MLTVLSYTILYLALFFCTDLLYHKANIKAEYTRKIAHIVTGLIALTFPFYFNYLWQVSLICISFFVLLIISEKMHWFQSITSVQRKSYGSWLFALAIFICFYSMKTFNNENFYFIPLWILTISDSLASIIGSNYPVRIFRFKHIEKSLVGTAIFLASTLVILGVFLIFSFLEIIAFSLIVTAVEFVSIKGTDNITIPLITILLLYFML